MKAHLKRIATPSSWTMKRKSNKYVIRPKPSGHPLAWSMPVVVAIRDILKFAKTAKEVKYMLQAKNVLVDGKPVKDHKRALGLMDTLEFPELGKIFRLLMNKNARLVLIEQKGNELLCRINNKSVLKGKKIQINLSNGMNVLANKDLYRTGDTIMLGQSKEIKEHIKLEQGVMAYFVGGKYVGKTGIVEEIKGMDIFFKKDSQVFQTPKKFAFVIGRDKAMIETGE